MNITIKGAKHTLTPEDETLIEKKLAAPLRLLGDEGAAALLEIDIEQAPPEGRSAEPFHLVANLTVNDKVFHAEAVKPSPESAADRVRGQLETEIRRSRGRARRLWREGSAKIKQMLHFDG